MQAKDFQLSLGSLENWTCACYFVNEPLNPEMVNINKTTLVPPDFVCFTVVDKLRKQYPAVQNEAKYGVFFILIHKSLHHPHHTHAFSHTIIRSIPTAKTYTNTLNKHKHISYLIKKMIFLAFPLMIVSLSAFVVS